MKYFAMFFLLIPFCLGGCDKNTDEVADPVNDGEINHELSGSRIALVLDDPIELKYRDCLYDQAEDSYLCFDSVLTDSRCPVGVVCVWAGEAIVRFKFLEGNQEESYFDLHSGVKDTLVNGYQIASIELLPYPEHGKEIKREDYKVKIVIGETQ